jgi:4-diphosphocytidyl-2-C-methyl-D-erythritol kinase
VGFSPPRFAPAKINLCLHVTGRRQDGYHLLDSLAIFAGAGDEVEAEPAEDLTLIIEGPFAAGLRAEPDNLVLRAARALAVAAGIAPRARITLHKHLPIASGIGGGSADAAAALRVLQRLWATGLPEPDLHALAASLGADVPVCLAAAPARMTGIGEILHPAPALPEFGLVLVNPGLAVSTPAVFRARQAGFSQPLALPEAWKDAAAMALDLAQLRNDLEPPAIGLCPAIGEVLRALRAAPGVLLARMSGSGATCFALTATASEAAQVAASTPGQGWWRWGGAPAGLSTVAKRSSSG